MSRNDKQRVLTHGHQGWNARHSLCHIYIRYVYIWVVYSFCLFCCFFIIVRWLYVWCIEWASGNQEEVQACLVTLWLFIISCYSLYKTTLGLLCSWFENNPYFHKYSTDFHVQCGYVDYFFYENYDWSNHSIIKCKFKKVNNWTTTTYAPIGAFDYTTNGVTMPAHSCMTPWGAGEWTVKPEGLNKIKQTMVGSGGKRGPADMS